MQRRDPRFPADYPVHVTIYSDPDLRVPARLKNLSGRGAGVLLTGPVDVGTAVKIEMDDAILLGEVIYCRRQEEDWYIGVELEQALRGLNALASALSAFGDPPSGSEQRDPVQHAGYQNQKQSH